MRASARANLLICAERDLAYAKVMLVPPLAGGRHYAHNRALAAVDALRSAVRLARLANEKSDG